MRKNLLPILSIGILLWACGPKAPPRIAAPEADGQRVLEGLRAFARGQENLKSARGYAKVKIKVKGRSATAEEALFIELPGRFRFETLDDLGNQRFLLVGDQDRFHAQEKGKPSRELSSKDLKRFLPMASSLEETLGLLVGKIPSLDLQQARVYAEGEPSLYRVLSPRAEILWDDARRLILSFAYREEHGKLAYRYGGDEFARASFRRSPSAAPKDSPLTPMRVRLEDLKTKNWVEIRYLNLEWNPDLSPSLFRVDPLKDAAGFDGQD